MNNIKSLTQMAWEYKCKQSPSIPKYAIPQPKYSEGSANCLTKCVYDFLKMKGHYCGRTNTTGTYSVKLGKFIHSGATRGQSDLNAIVNGRSWQIEIKHGKDQLSEVQKRICEQVRSAGGVYIVARSFVDFITQYIELTKASESDLFSLQQSESEQKIINPLIYSQR